LINILKEHENMLFAAKWNKQSSLIVTCGNDKRAIVISSIEC
jgi:WD40 repeat protein